MNTPVTITSTDPTRWSWVGADLLCPICTYVAILEGESPARATARDLFDRGTAQYGIRCDTCFCGPTYDLEQAVSA